MRTACTQGCMACLQSQLRIKRRLNVLILLVFHNKEVSLASVCLPPGWALKTCFFVPPVVMIPMILTGSEISRQWWCWAKKPTNKKKPFHPEDNLLSLNWSRRRRWCDERRIRNINKTLRFPRRISFYFRSGERSADENRRISSWKK